MRRLVAAMGVATAVAVTGCTGVAHADPTPERDTGGRIVTGPSSTAFPLEGRNIRLVRVDDRDIALQFELYNGSDEGVAPYDIGMGLIERDLKLVDMVRATSYDVQTATGFDGRIGADQYDEIAPGTSRTITAVFTAPPKDTTSMWFLTDVLQPVEVPIQPVGSPRLTDDPVLSGARDDEPYVNALMCVSTGPEGPGEQAPVEIRLPSDVLFEFGKSELTPAAQAALDAVESQLGGSGTVTVEGHTDAIGDEASNQALSEARAESVRAALQERLGSGITLRTVGFGESRPVAPNTRPDGGDNPDGRALNRRVEIRAGATTAAVPAELEPLPATTDLADAGAVATVDSVRRVDGHLLVTVALTNPTPLPIDIPTDSGLTVGGYRPEGITVADRVTQRRASQCHSGTELLEGFRDLTGPPSNLYSPDGVLPAGASVRLWAVYPEPPVDVTEVEVEMGGLGSVQRAPITA